MKGVAKGDLEKRNIEIDDRFNTAVMLTSGGYPGHYEKGHEISGLELTDECILFHAGTKIADGKGGEHQEEGYLPSALMERRLEDALAGSYRNARLIEFRDVYYRTDIGFDL